jgi:hypothetical protein
MHEKWLNGCKPAVKVVKLRKMRNKTPLVTLAMRSSTPDPPGPEKTRYREIRPACHEPWPVSGSFWNQASDLPSKTAVPGVPAARGPNG